MHFRAGTNNYFPYHSSIRLVVGSMKCQKMIQKKSEVFFSVILFDQQTQKYIMFIIT